MKRYTITQKYEVIVFVKRHDKNNCGFGGIDTAVEKFGISRSRITKWSEDSSVHKQICEDYRSEVGEKFMEVKARKLDDDK